MKVFPKYCANEAFPDGTGALQQASTWTVVCFRWVCEGVFSFLFLNVSYAILMTEEVK